MGEGPGRAAEVRRLLGALMASGILCPSGLMLAPIPLSFALRRFVVVHVFDGTTAEFSYF